MINIVRYERLEHLLWDVQQCEVAYAVSGEAHDYVAETSVRLRQFAKQQFTYPFYIHFESDADAVTDILQHMNAPIQYKPSGRTVTTQIGRACFQAEVPAFTVEIAEEAALHEVFDYAFHHAFNNHFWAITQHNSVTYEHGFPNITLQRNELVLLTEHDAYGFTVVTNEQLQEDALRHLLQRAFSASFTLVKSLKDVRFPKIDARFFTYDLLSEQRTDMVMQSFIKSRWTFPVTLYIECIDDVRAVTLPVKKIRSIKKMMYVTAQGWQREYIPAYAIQLDDEAMLTEAFAAFFYVAEQNFLFALTNEPSLFYDGYSVTTTSNTVEIITASYDGQGAVLMTMKEEA